MCGLRAHIRIAVLHSRVTYLGGGALMSIWWAQKAFHFADGQDILHHMSFDTYEESNEGLDLESLNCRILIAHTH